MIGIYDTYYYLNFIFGKIDPSIGLDQSLPIIEIFFGLLPANFFILKIIMFSICFISAIIFYNTCKLYVSNYWSLLGTIILVIFPFSSRQFTNFETCIFSLIFMFYSIYFINLNMCKFENKSIMPNKIIFINKYTLISLFLLLISVIFWRFTIYYIPIFLILSNFDLVCIIATWLIIPFLPFLYNYILPNQHISECMSFTAIIPLSFFYKTYVFRYLNIKHIIIITILTIVSIIKYKFIYLLFPFLIINFVIVMSKINQLKAKIFVFMLIGMSIIGTTYMNITSIPNNDTKRILDVAKSISISENKKINVSWDLQYYAQWNGIDNNYTGYHEDMIYKDIVITYPKDPNLTNHDCNMITKIKDIWLFNC